MGGYDIIGDIHGYAGLLKKLLESLGYQQTDNSWNHPDRTAIFVGDFLNRGPEIRETLLIVRSMVESGAALTILGNHEYRAILYHIKNQKGMFMSRQMSGNRNQMQKTLTAFKNHKEEWKEHLKWMRSLPLFLDLGNFRVIHAYWNDKDVEKIKSFFPEGKLKKSILKDLHKNHPEESAIVYNILKGLEFKCPKDLILRCNKGLSRKVFTLNWWESPENKTFREINFGNKFILPDYHIPDELALHYEPYTPDQPIVFIGHYCLSEGATLLQKNICCLDSCVDTTGVLSAYRWSGEKELTKDNIVTVSRTIEYLFGIQSFKF